ncbi:facilitated trehalose transporter Tret1-like [Amyelois transitella]|uniref:facilitated trehalose transporter Tret1-like n=1 Tax=Amyelois transitella TaxID=680683 RepID=UPI00298FBC11|nr:facilitated trehalose transporter Tret1-like [Amyelois transitella]
MKKPGRVSVHLFRQVLAAIATSLHGLSAGIVFGHSAVLLPQLKEDHTIVYDAKYDSWIASITALCMALGCIIAGSIIDRFGRRVGLIFLAIPFVFSWLLMAFSKSVSLLLIGRAITGICSGAFRPMSIVYISEVSDPKHRSMLLVSTSLSSNIGVLIAHSVGTYLYWKTASIVFCVPNLLAVVILLYLKESPLWLISKGKTNEGSNIFYWFREKTEAANNELSIVINKQKIKSQDLNIKDTFKVVFSKAFLGPFAICFVIFAEAQFCGTNVLNFYAADIIKSTFSDNVDNFSIMMLVDALRVGGTGTVFCTVKHVPRRFLYLLCSIITTVCIFCLASYLYFETSNLLWFGLMSLVLYIYFSVTLISTGWSFTSEMYPSSVRGLGSAATSSMSFLLLFIIVKIAPGIIDTFGISVFYLMCASITAVSTVILYFVLPETNGKTLQEIEDSLNKQKEQEISIDRASSEQTKI